MVNNARQQTQNMNTREEKRRKRINTKEEEEKKRREEKSESPSSFCLRKCLLHEFGCKEIVGEDAMRLHILEFSEYHLELVRNGVSVLRLSLIHI